MIKAMVDDPEEVRDVCNVSVRLYLMYPYRINIPHFLGTGWLVHNTCVGAYQDRSEAQVLLAARGTYCHGRGVREALFDDVGRVKKSSQTGPQTWTPQYGEGCAASGGRRCKSIPVAQLCEYIAESISYRRCV